MKAWNHPIRVAQDLVVVGQHLEYADLCNPTGLIRGVCWFVVTSSLNYDYMHFAIFETEEEALKLKGRIEKAPNTWTPVNNEHWSARKVYGSSEWNDLDEMELKRAEYEGEFGPGSFMNRQVA